MKPVEIDTLPCIKKFKCFLVILLLLIAIFGIICPIIMLTFVKGGHTMPDWLLEIIIGLVTGVGTSIAVTVVTYFKFLKKIPEETEKKINDLLNARLGYETTQHGNVMEALNPNNHALSLDHRYLQQCVNEIKIGVEILKEKNQADYSMLDEAGKHIVRNVEELSKFSLLFEDVNKKNLELLEQNQELRKKIATMEQERSLSKKPRRTDISLY